MARLRTWVLFALIGGLTGCSRSTPRPAEADAIRLTASMVSPVDIALEWHDPATDVAGHVLEYTNHPETEAYVPLGFFPPNHTKFIHPRLIPETKFYYRVRAYYGPASNPVEVSLPKELTAAAYAAAYALPEDYRWAPPATLPESSNVAKKSVRNTTTPADAAPSNLKAELATNTVSGFKLTWTDRSTDEQGFFLESKRAGSAEFLVCALVEPDINSFGWAFEPPETSGSFRIRAYYYGEPSNVAMLLTGKDPAHASPSRSSTGPAWQQSLQQLRGAGVPDTVLAGLVVADFEIRWQKQWREFEQRYQAGVVDDDERARFEARRDDEQEKELRVALGDEGFRQWDKDHTLRDLDLVELQLSSSQTDALYQLRKDRARKDRTLAEAWRNGEIDEADYNEQQSAAQQEYDQQFKMLLGDERYEALQNAEEGMAGALRQKVKNLNPVDSQFEVMVEAERQWHQQRAELERRAQQTPDQRQAYEQQLRALAAARAQEYQRVLGTNDFDQLQKNQDSRYQRLKRYANTWSLSESDIDYIYSSVQHYQEMNQHSRDQVEQSLVSYLGPERFERLKKNDLFNSGEQ